MGQILELIKFKRKLDKALVQAKVVVGILLWAILLNFSKGLEWRGREVEGCGNQVGEGWCASPARPIGTWGWSWRGWSWKW